MLGMSKLLVGVIDRCDQKAEQPPIVKEGKLRIFGGHDNPDLKLFPDSRFPQSTTRQLVGLNLVHSHDMAKNIAFASIERIGRTDLDKPLIHHHLPSYFRESGRLYVCTMPDPLRVVLNNCTGNSLEFLGTLWALWAHTHISDQRLLSISLSPLSIRPNQKAGKDELAAQEHELAQSDLWIYWKGVPAETKQKIREACPNLGEGLLSESPLAFLEVFMRPYNMNPNYKGWSYKIKGVEGGKLSGWQYAHLANEKREWKEPMYSYFPDLIGGKNLEE